MIKIVNDINEYLDWIDPLCFDTRFSTPFCDKARVTAVSNKENHRLLCAYDGDRLVGIFCLLVLEEEEYIETVFLYTKEKKAYEDLMDYLSKQYKGYEIWFVYNPKNDVLGNYLSEKQAFFYTEQRYMEYKGVKKADVSEVIPYCDSYKNEYISIHNKEGYWDGEKVLANIEDFYIYLYIQNQHLVGYIDLSKENDTNEIMDLWILPEYRNQGIGGLLLKKAIFANGDKRLVLTVDIDNAPAIHLYEKMGFEEISANNNITAKFTL